MQRTHINTIRQPKLFRRRTITANFMFFRPFIIFANEAKEFAYVEKVKLVKYLRGIGAVR